MICPRCKKRVTSIAAKGLCAACYEASRKALSLEEVARATAIKLHDDPDERVRRVKMHAMRVQEMTQGRF